MKKFLTIFIFLFVASLAVPQLFAGQREAESDDLKMTDTKENIKELKTWNIRFIRALKTTGVRGDSITHLQWPGGSGKGNVNDFRAIRMRDNIILMLIEELKKGDIRPAEIRTILKRAIDNADGLILSDEVGK